MFAHGQSNVVVPYRDNRDTLLELLALWSDLLQQPLRQIELHNVTRRCACVDSLIVVRHSDRRDLALNAPGGHILRHGLAGVGVDVPHPQCVVPTADECGVRLIGKGDARCDTATAVRCSLVKQGLPRRHIPDRECTVIKTTWGEQPGRV